MGHLTIGSSALLTRPPRFFTGVLITPSGRAEHGDLTVTQYDAAIPVTRFAGEPFFCPPPDTQGDHHLIIAEGYAIQETIPPGRDRSGRARSSPPASWQWPV